MIRLSRYPEEKNTGLYNRTRCPSVTVTSRFLKMIGSRCHRYKQSCPRYACPDKPRGLLQLFLGQGVVLVRHADVIEDIRVAGFRDHDPARYLPVLVRILVDQLELPRGRVIIDLEIIAGQLARLELDVLGQPGDLVLVRIKGGYP